MGIERGIISVVIAYSLITMAVATTGTASYYATYVRFVASVCYGYQDQGTIIAAAAANRALYNNGAACGKRYKIRCTGDTKQTPNPCRGGEVTVKIVDLCPECAPHQLDLSQQIFATIGNPDAGKIRIEYTP